MTDQPNKEAPSLKQVVGPCPFCGSAAAPMLLSDRDISEVGDCDCDCHSCDHLNFAVCCRANDGGCGATSGYETVERKAVDKWNRRVS